MGADLHDAYHSASNAAEVIYSYIEQHGEWENDELLDSWNYFRKQAEHYNRTLEVLCDEYERLV